MCVYGMQPHKAHRAGCDCRPVKASSLLTTEDASPSEGGQTVSLSWSTMSEWHSVTGGKLAAAEAASRFTGRTVILLARRRQSLASR